MKNHFHFLIRIRTKEEQQKIFEEQISNGKQEFKIKEPSRQFAHLFNKYTKNFNKWMSRTGKLFEQSFKRKEISDESYLIHVLCYIHRNPIHHKVEEKYNTYPYSSYRALLSNASTRLEKEKVLTWFQGEKAFINAHKEMKSKIIPKTMLE